jgi:hypothetical protein
VEGVIHRSISYAKQSPSRVICRSLLSTVTVTLLQQGRDVWSFLEQAGLRCTVVARCHRSLRITEGATSICAVMNHRSGGPAAEIMSLIVPNPERVESAITSIHRPYFPWVLLTPKESRTTPFAMSPHKPIRSY